MLFASFKKKKRTAPAPVVGWPPIRSFRKNLASSSSVKPAAEVQNVVPSKSANKKPMEICQKGLFVKINMDGIPIGRKVDLKAYDSYDKLSSAVDQLFKGLLAGLPIYSFQLKMFFFFVYTPWIIVSSFYPSLLKY